MNLSVTPHPWSEDSLFCKAQLYIERMEAHPADDWQFGFWSALALEHLARAALAHISPVLLAGSQDWRNLTYALGSEPTTLRFVPRAIPPSDAISRMKELIPDFNDEVAGFCTQHLRRRNSELHSGELAFALLGTSEWLPRFYLTCAVLLQSMNKELGDLISAPSKAQELIDAHEDAAASSVKNDIKAYKQVWSKKDLKEQEEATMQASTWATRHAGHRVDCPACNSQALLQGTPSGPVTTKVEEYEVTERQSMLPTSFECIACGRRIAGLSKLAASGLGNAYSVKYSYTAAEYFQLYTEEEMEEARNEMPYEPDFNE